MGKSGILKFTGGLRWVKRVTAQSVKTHEETWGTMVLQQEFSDPLTGHSEWQDVPVEEE